MNNSDLKGRLAKGDTLVGSWLTLPSTAIAEIMAKAGFHWLTVDLEHSVIPIDVAGEMIRIIDLCGVAPLVRLTSNDPNQIKRVLDAGAHGIIIPMISSAEGARLAVAATRYAPSGTRGVGLARAQGYGAAFSDYLAWQEAGPVVIVQIEHIDAIPELEAILTVPGVDGLIIGPYDLSASMGIAGKFEEPSFLDAMARIREAAARFDKPAGLHLVEPDPDALARTLGEGYRFVAYSVDIRILDVGARVGTARRAEA